MTQGLYENKNNHSSEICKRLCVKPSEAAVVEGAIIHADVPAVYTVYAAYS